MRNLQLTKLALRYQALYLGIEKDGLDLSSAITPPVMAFVARLKENGYTVSEELLHALNEVSVDKLIEITEVINDVMGVNLNWTPLVKQWNIPTGESLLDHLITLFVNCFYKDEIKGTTLPCGHLIPDGTFPIERYNGCPFCGMSFVKSDSVYKGQGSKLKELRLFTEEEIQRVFQTLLGSPTPLDASQKDTLKMFLSIYDVPENISIEMKETSMFVIKSMVEVGKYEVAGKLLKSPTDILRYLWYEKTRYVQIIEPKTLVLHARKMYYHMWGTFDKSTDAATEMKKKLRLKYNRSTCRMVALWLNAIEMSAVQAAENMNPKRGMWVRMIRALRLGEYSRKKGFEHLANILDVFYKQEYETWQGKIDKARIDKDADAVVEMLKHRPGLFARCLFATMLRFGKDKTLSAFNEIADKLPARLLLSLGNSAESYFDVRMTRLARPITGGTRPIPVNKLLSLYSLEERNEMVKGVFDIFKSSMGRRFAFAKTENHSMYIEHSLYDIPVNVGDRATTIQDTSCALMGTRFKVEGDAVRLFMQWGKGLHRQHLDMDLSCRISLSTKKVVECSFYNLTCIGAKHSGDIRSIPEMVGTAEYIELSMPELLEAGAKYVTITCNAYSCGVLSPNLVVGWMNSSYPMQISETDGVAYDPSCVQHMVRISDNNLSKAIVFGVLDVERREIVWLEMPFSSQTIRGCDSNSVEDLLNKLESKLSIGELLEMKAKAQNLDIVESADDADEVYTYEWALNPSEVSNLLLV